MSGAQRSELCRAGRGLARRKGFGSDCEAGATNAVAIAPQPAHAQLCREVYEQPGANDTPYPHASSRCGIALNAAPAPRKLRITVTFAGVHDDSSAALAASDGDQPIDCGKAGKTRIDGEESGDTLVCPFTLAAKAGTRQITVNLIWHHADPASFALRAD